MNGATKIYGCLADPIEHVMAPTLFTSIFEKRNLNAVMIPIHVKQNNLENVVKSLKLTKNFYGMTVTIPHKTAIAKICDILDEDAFLTGAVNWIKFDKNRNLIGNNFDGQGFVNGFLSQKQILKGKKICMFGAGGAAVAIAGALIDAKTASLKIVNRNMTNASNLKEKIVKKSKNYKVEIYSENNYKIDDCDLIINATSLGLSENDKIPFDVSKTSKHCVIADIIMKPKDTKLLKKAKSLGRSIHYGKHMIEGQIDLVGRFLGVW